MYPTLKYQRPPHLLRERYESFRMRGDSIIGVYETYRAGSTSLAHFSLPKFTRKVYDIDGDLIDYQFISDNEVAILTTTKFTILNTLSLSIKVSTRIEQQPVAFITINLLGKIIFLLHCRNNSLIILDHVGIKQIEIPSSACPWTKDIVKLYSHNGNRNFVLLRDNSLHLLVVMEPPYNVSLVEIVKIPHAASRIGSFVNEINEVYLVTREENSIAIRNVGQANHTVIYPSDNFLKYKNLFGWASIKTCHLLGNNYLLLTLSQIFGDDPVFIFDIKSGKIIFILENTSGNLTPIGINPEKKLFYTYNYAELPPSMAASGIVPYNISNGIYTWHYETSQPMATTSISDMEL